MKKIDFSKIISNSGTFLKENKKPLLYIGGAAIVVVAGYAIVSGIKGGIDGFFGSGKDVKGATDFQDLPVDTTKATITTILANTYANQLYNAMKSSNGTDTGKIKAIMNAINGEDYKMIYNAFKTKSYYLFGDPTFTAYLFGYSDLDLNEWFKKEVNQYLDFITYSLIKKRSTEAGIAF